MEMKEEESERDKSNSLEIGEEPRALHYVDPIKFFTVKKEKRNMENYVYLSPEGRAEDEGS